METRQSISRSASDPTPVRELQKCEILNRVQLDRFFESVYSTLCPDVALLLRGLRIMSRIASTCDLLASSANGVGTAGLVDPISLFCLDILQHATLHYRRKTTPRWRCATVGDHVSYCMLCFLYAYSSWSWWLSHWKSPSRLEPCRFVGPEPTFLLVGRATAGPAWFTACEQPKLNEVHEVLNAMDRQDTIWSEQCTEHGYSEGSSRTPGSMHAMQPLRRIGSIAV